MRILGIDSAISRCGWALVERVRGVGREKLLGRGVLCAVDGEVVQEFAGRMTNGKDEIDLVVIEDAYLDKNVDTVKQLSRLVGRWEQAFETLGVETKLVMASVWQMRILTGLITPKSKRDERKLAAKRWAKATFNEDLGPDEADASAIATHEIRLRSFAELTSG